MRKFILFALASGLGSVSGLVGCKSESPDKAARSEPPRVIIEKDKFNARLTIEQGKGPLEVRLVSHVDLQDRLDFDGAVTVKTHTQCGSLGVERTFGEKESATIAQLLPDEVLPRDLATKPEACTLHFELRNALGSLWVLSHQAVIVHDENPPALKIGRDDGTEVSLNVAGATPMDGIRIRGPATGDSLFACEDATFTGPRFDQVIDYLHFDFARPNLRAGRHPRGMAEHRYEMCRALVLQKGRMIAFSRPQRVQFPRLPLYIRDFPLDPAQGWRDYLAGKPIVLRQFELQNTENFPRKVIIQGEGYLVRGDVMRRSSRGLDRSHSDVRYVLLEIPGLPDRGVSRREVTIPPGTAMPMRMVFQRFNTLKCSGDEVQSSMSEKFAHLTAEKPVVEAVQFTMLDPVTAIEVEPDGSSIQYLQLGQGVSRLVAPGPINPGAYGSPSNSCEWR